MRRWWSNYKHRLLPLLAARASAGALTPATCSANLPNDHLLFLVDHALGAAWKNTASSRFGFTLAIGVSMQQGAGSGLFVENGLIQQGEIAAFYPGTVYQPGDSVLLQSIANRYVLRCSDGVLIDGKPSGLSASIFKSCVARDSTPLERAADSDWLTLCADASAGRLRSASCAQLDNPLAVGQIVNNHAPPHFPANVTYQEVLVPSECDDDRQSRCLLPNIRFRAIGEDDGSTLRVVILVALRDISAGEELLSSYLSYTPVLT